MERLSRWIGVARHSNLFFRPGDGPTLGDLCSTRCHIVAAHQSSEPMTRTDEKQGVLHCGFLLEEIPAGGWIE